MNNFNKRIRKKELLKKGREPKRVYRSLGIISWSLIGLIAICGFFLYVLYLMKSALIPLLIGLIIAYILIPVVKLFQKKMRRIFAVVLTYFLFISLIFLTLFFVIPLVIEQFKSFISSIPFYMGSLTKFLNNYIQNSVFLENISGIFGADAMPANADEVTAYILAELNIENFNLFASATVFTRTAFSLILNFIIGPILGFYILKDSEKIAAGFMSMLPKKAGAQTEIVIGKINKVFGRYIRGQLLISLIVGIMCTVALLLLRVEFAVLLGFTAGIFNLIPFLGPFIGGIPAALTALFVSPLKALLVILVFAAIQQIDNYIISPNIMKHQVGVNPGIVIFSLIAGGALFGWIGLLLAVPTIAITQEILRYYLLEKKHTASL